VPHVAEGHVLAKRYLVFAESDYYEKLSSVSKRTLEFQGGPMNESEAKIFKADPNFGTCIEMRRWDEGAKQPIWKVDDLASYEQMVKQCIVYPLSKPLPSRTFLRTGNVIVGLGSGRDCDDGERATKKLKTEPTTVEVWNPVIPSIPVLRSPRQTQLMADWATKGFAVIKRSDWLSEDECNDLVAQCDGVSALKASATTDGVGPFHTFEASQVSDFKPMPSRTEAFVDHHPKLKEFLCGPSSRLQAIASHLAGEQTALYKDKLNYKLAGGGGYRPHQDGYQGLGVAQYKSKADRGFVTCVCMVAIDDSDETNGCPQLSPEVWAKKEGFLKIKDPNNNEEMGPFTPIPMKRGDVLIYDNFMPHKSDSNASLRDRRALFGVYYGAETTKRDLRTEYYQAEANNRRKQNSSAIDGKANIYHTGTPAANPV